MHGPCVLLGPQIDAKFKKSLKLIVYTPQDSTDLDLEVQMAEFGLPIQECTKLRRACRWAAGMRRRRRHQRKGHFARTLRRTLFGGESERAGEGGRAIQTAINKHVEGDTISWPQEQLPLSPSTSFLPGARQGCQVQMREHSPEQSAPIIVSGHLVTS